MPQLTIHTIKKETFNHGETRNLAVKLSHGKYICFFSQDIDILDEQVLAYFEEDLHTNEEAVAVFGKQIPYEETNLIQQLDIICWYDLLGQFTNKKGVLVQTRKKPFVPLNRANSQLWYFLSDAFICYKKSFLNSHPFQRVSYGEDVIMGEKIIREGLTKIYDSRAIARHSHFHSFREHIRRLHDDFRLRLKDKNFIRSNLFFKKVKILFTMNNLNFFQKYQCLSLLVLDYAVKAFILFKTKIT